MSTTTAAHHHRHRHHVQWKYIYKGREFLFTYNALGCIHPTNPLREFCIRIMSDPIFDNTILLLIALNSVRPLPRAY